jgi:hypothetical protein
MDTPACSSEHALRKGLLFAGFERFSFSNHHHPWGEGSLFHTAYGEEWFGGNVGDFLVARMAM